MRSVICYIPGPEREDKINYLCSDNKVHVRFRDFNKPCIIAGFEHKLTYLLTYLMNYSYRNKALFNYSPEKLIKAFSHSEDIAQINRCIQDEVCDKRYRGIKIRKKYTKILDDTYKPFGDVKIECFPLNIIDSIASSGDLSFFLASFKVNLREYLFNDNYVIIIDYINISEVNKKFINKMEKKNETATQNNQCAAELW